MGGSSGARVPAGRGRRRRPPRGLRGARLPAGSRTQDGASARVRQDGNSAGWLGAGAQAEGVRPGALSPQRRWGAGGAGGPGGGGRERGAERGRPTPTCGPGQPPRARPSASPPPPALVAPRLLLRGRRRPGPRRARARLPAAAPRRLARQPGEHRAALRSPTPLAGERRPRRLPHVSPGCPVSRQFPPGPQRRLRRCCHRLSHIPGLQGSRRRAAPRRDHHHPRRVCPALGCPAPRRPSRPGSVGGDRAGGRRSPPAHNPPRGAAGAGGPRPGLAGGALAASREAPALTRPGGPPGAGHAPRGFPAPPRIAPHVKPETHAELLLSPRPAPPGAVRGRTRGRRPPRG